MQEQFVPYKESLELKELGFNEPVFGVYGYTPENNIKSPEDKLLFLHEIISFENFNMTPKDIKNSNIGDDVSAPLWQQAFDWFRNTYDIESFITPTIKDNYKNYEIHIVYKNHKLRKKFIKTYKEARLACLQKLIEIVKTKK